MGGQSRAAQRRRQRKQRKQTNDEHPPAQTKAESVSSKKKPLSKPSKTSMSRFDSDSEEEGPMDVLIPLPSLEKGSVRAFTTQEEEDAFQSSSVSSSSVAKTKTSNRKRKHQENESAGNGILTSSSSSIQSAKQKKIRAEKVVWRKFDRENELYAKYYKSQFKFDSSEWMELTSALSTPLPVYFRVNALKRSFAENIMETLVHDFEEIDGSPFKDPISGEQRKLNLTHKHAIKDEFLWKLNITRKDLRKLPVADLLNTYLSFNCSLGSMHFVDTMNIVIPSLLDVNANNKVLDMYAAGGIRAGLITEKLVQAGEDSSTPSGVLVLNDPDVKSAANAAQNLEKSLPFHSHVLVSNNKVEDFPIAKQHENTGFFDRVVCTPPCSGDGMIRRHPEKWRCWDPSTCWKDHSTQLASIKRGMEVLKVDGTLVFASRSINPIENEAVVAEVLRSGDGAYELVDSRDQVPLQKFSSGVSSWTVEDKQGAVIDSWDDVIDAMKHEIQASMWPPSEDEAKEMKLDRCVRVFPHFQDTNGMFFAVLRKKKHVDPVLAGPEMPVSLTTAKERKTTSKRPNKNKPSKSTSHRLDVFEQVNGQDLDHIRSFYGLNSVPSECFLRKTELSDAKRIHYVSPHLSEVITALVCGGGKYSIAIVSPGSVLFKRHMKTEGKLPCTSCAFELHMRAFAQWHKLTNSTTTNPSRMVEVEMEFFDELMTKKEIWLQNISNKALRAQLQGMENGGMVFVLDESDPVQTTELDIVLCVWKSHSSIRLGVTPGEVGYVKNVIKTFLDHGEPHEGEDYDYDSM